VEKDVSNVVKCPSCDESRCIRCYNDHSENSNCQEFLEWKELNDKADEIFDSEVKRRKYQICPSCGRYVEKISGCNNIQCRCGKSFYWIEIC
jgi:hypothetical protein